MHRWWSHRSATAVPSATHTHSHIVEILCRRAFAEGADVVDKLHCNIPANGEVCGVLDVVCTHTTPKIAVLVEDVIHTNAQLTTLILEEFLANVGVAEQNLLVVVVGDTFILVIGTIGSEGESLPDNPLEIHASIVAQIFVVLCENFRLVIINRVAEIVGKREVQILTDVTTNLHARGVVLSHHNIQIVIYLAGCTIEVGIQGECNVTLDDIQREAVADTRKDVPVVEARDVLVGAVCVTYAQHLAIVAGDFKVGVVHLDGGGDRPCGCPHTAVQHQSLSLFDVGIGVEQHQSVGVAGLQIGVTCCVARTIHIGSLLQLTDGGVLGTRV